jgi:hypothetical protein
MDELKKKFNLTPEEYLAMRTAQNDTCAICNEPLRAGKGGHGIDHHRETKRVRKLLCQGCNTGIGLFKENPDYLRAAIKYLEEENGHVKGRYENTVDVQRTADDITIPAK